MDGRHGKLRPGVERAGAFAGVAGTDQVELAGGNHTADQLGRFGLDAGLILAVGFLLQLLADQASQHDGVPGPLLGRFDRIQEIGGLWTVVGGRFFNAHLLAVHFRVFAVHRPLSTVHFFFLLLGFLVGLFLLRRHAGRNLLLAQRGQQVFEALAVVGQHVPQPG
ncbi:MAG: hypothetical protein GX616_10450 [Planctomycetes bacterium]|nr:hypothetical protein [Planctomycetota bacterium]